MTYNPNAVQPTNNPQPIQKPVAQSKTRPTEEPKTRRDFKKVLQQKTDEIEETDPEFAAEVVEDSGEDSDDGIAEGPKKGVFSLFGTGSSKSSTTTTSSTTSSQPTSLASLFGSPVTGSREKGDLDDAIEVGRAAKGSSKSKISDTPDLQEEIAKPSGDSSTEAYARLSGNKKDFSSDTSAGDSKSESGATFTSSLFASAKTDKDQFTTRFATPQPDLSYVNPMAATAPVSQTENVAEPSKATLPTSHIQEIINAMVDKITQMELNGKTETTIVLKQPPVLAGANLVVTSFDSAHGEFNISFENLTQVAKNLLDLPANQASLLRALDEKGYTVQILTTTTIIQTPIVNNTPPSSDQQSDRRDEDKGQGQQGQEQPQE